MHRFVQQIKLSNSCYLVQKVMEEDDFHLDVPRSTEWELMTFAVF